MLVFEDGCRAAITFEHPNHFLKKLLTGIKDLPLRVLRIVAVLSDDQDGIHGQLAASTAEGFGDGEINGEPVFLCAGGAQITCWALIDLEGD